MIYPDYGVQLFEATNYSTSSNITAIHYNTTSRPMVFPLNSTWAGAEGCYITKYNSGWFNSNNASSIKVFYRGTELKIGGIP